jgi:mannose-1-phosphate guanylyltransferase
MKRPIHAMLLCAGLGTRLRPITLTTPKCLVEIGGIPLLECWLQKLEAIGCNQALVNTHYLAEKVEAFTATRHKSKMKVKTAYEPELLGTAGTLATNKEFFKQSTVIMIHADNATNTDIAKLLEAHANRPKTCVMTMLTFETDRPKRCGIVEIDELGVVKSFHEKVEDPPGNRANGAIYVFEADFIEEVIENRPGSKDFSTEILPMLMNKIYTHHIKDDFLDIGTPESLAQARKIWGTKG